MVSKQNILKEIDNCLTDTSFLSLPNPRFGKVRDVYSNKSGNQLILITTDRQSAFDRVLASIPFKGQILNLVSEFWFEQTKDIVPNHLISIPDPNVTLAKKCTVFPIEFVVRGYLTGTTDTAAWTLYSKGHRDICGNILPDGMVKNQKFSTPILTPTTKAELHDEPISAREILQRGIIGKETWQRMEAIVFALFQRGTRIAQQNGLILVDTKYELGLDEEGTITLIDEIHTPDSSRYWLANSYQERFLQGKEPENIDKEFLRLWFKDHCDPYHDAVLPKAPDELIVELSSRYIQLYEMITGKEFTPPSDSLPIRERIRKNLSVLS